MNPSDYASDLATQGLFENAVTLFEEHIKDLPDLHHLQLREMLSERLAFAALGIVASIIEEHEAGDLDLDE